MMAQRFTDSELEAYLEEALDAERSAEIERLARDDPKLRGRLGQISARRDAGVHSIGEVWRRHQIGVPSTDELGSYLLGVLPPEHAEYLRFRIEALKCRFTIAKLQDLQRQQEEGDDQVSQRRRKYFQSTAGYLKDST